MNRWRYRGGVWRPSLRIRARRAVAWVRCHWLGLHRPVTRITEITRPEADGFGGIRFDVLAKTRVCRDCETPCP